MHRLYSLSYFETELLGSFATVHQWLDNFLQNKDDPISLSIFFYAASEKPDSIFPVTVGDVAGKRLAEIRGRRVIL